MFILLMQAPFVSDGARLYLRENPPADDALEYGSDEPGEFLGRALLATAGPCWMSAHFADVLAEQSDPAAHLEIYSQDWMETIIYLPEDDPNQTVAVEVVKFSNAILSPLGTGCQRLSPRTTIKAVGKSLSVLEPGPYYAIVSKSGGENRIDVLEITIARLGHRDRFIGSALHKSTLSLCAGLRTANPEITTLLSRRRNALAAIQGLPDTFTP